MNERYRFFKSDNVFSSFYSGLMFNIYNKSGEYLLFYRYGYSAAYPYPVIIFIGDIISKWAYRNTRYYNIGIHRRKKGQRLSRCPWKVKMTVYSPRHFLALAIA